MIVTISVRRESGPSEQFVTYSKVFGSLDNEDSTTINMYLKALKDVAQFIYGELMKVGWIK